MEQGQPGVAVLLDGFPAISNLHEVLTQRADNFLPPAVDDILLKFFECDVHDVVVMQFLGRDFVAEFEPEAVEQIDFFGR
jgi:hypothetical protein